MHAAGRSRSINAMPQDKVFVTAPDVPLGWWEFYAVTDDNPANPDAATTSVCEASCAAQVSAESTCCA